MPTDFPASLRAAEKHLAAASPLFAQIIDRVGSCTLTPETDLFRVLTRAMIAQLISTAAARTITARFEAKLKGRITPTGVLKLTDDDLSACGISGGKRRAIRELAEHFRANRGFARKVAEAEDAIVRELLLPLRGIGPWTVDMVMMFSMCRLDVLPVGDMGFRAGVKELFSLTELPTPVALTKMAEPWRPYRSVATWYVWRSRGWVPQSGNDG